MNKEPTEFQYFKAWLLFFVIASACSWLIAGGRQLFAAFLGAGGMPLPQMTRSRRSSAS